jgi:hypothetical protein
MDELLRLIHRLTFTVDEIAYVHFIFHSLELLGVSVNGLRSFRVPTGWKKPSLTIVNINKATGASVM